MDAARAASNSVLLKPESFADRGAFVKDFVRRSGWRRAAG